MTRGRTEEDQELSVKDITKIVTEEFHKVGLSPDSPKDKPIISPKGSIPRRDYEKAMLRITERCLVEPPKRAPGTLRDIIGYVNQRVTEDVCFAQEAKGAYFMNPFPLPPQESPPRR
ncbi:MAG: hypothetical protein Q8L27_05070 [archaeon]|nr:hypothetical protein [archaeon]